MNENDKGGMLLALTAEERRALNAVLEGFLTKVGLPETPYSLALQKIKDKLFP